MTRTHEPHEAEEGAKEMKRSELARMTYTKLVSTAYDADAQSLILSKGLVRQMAQLADFAVDALAAVDSGTTYAVSEIARHHFPAPKEDEVADRGHCDEVPAS
jgi:hypothetical protein